MEATLWRPTHPHHPHLPGTTAATAVPPPPPGTCLAASCSDNQECMLASGDQCVCFTGSNTALSHRRGHRDLRRVSGHGSRLFGLDRVLRAVELSGQWGLWAEAETTPGL